MAVASPSQDVEQLVAAWGLWARGTTDRLGLPRVSNIYRMAHHARKDVKKPKRRAVREARKTRDPKKIAIALGNADAELTARGKQTPVCVPVTIGYVPSDISRIEHIVRHLPGAYYAVIYRRYVYLQPDRIAAKELDVEREAYTARVEEALDYISEKFARHTLDSV